MSRDLQYRIASAVVDKSELAQRAQDDDALPIAFSSEYPVERMDWSTGEKYLEVLSHAPGAMDMSRAKDGLPFILSHDTRGDQFGRVNGIALSDDRRGRGRLRFSRSARGQEIRQDYEDGIRTDLSVGYITHGEPTKTRNADGMLVYTYHRWTPYEVSAVSVPADPTVGVGRSETVSAQTPHTPPAVTARSEAMDPVLSGAPAPTPAPALTVHPDTATLERHRSITTMASAAGLSITEADALVRSERTLADIGAELLRRASTVTPPTPDVVQLTDKEQKQYSVLRAVQAAASGNRGDAGFEMEVSDDIAKKTGRAARDKGFYMPLSLRTQLSFVAGAGKGAELRATELRPELIELLRNRSLVLGSLGARFMSGLQGNVSFPRQTAAMAATWGTEAPGAPGVALSSPSFDQVTLSPRTLVGSIEVSRQMMIQSTPDAEDIVRQDITAQHAIAIDAAALAGPAAGNNPVGALFATGTNLIAMGTNGAQMTLAKLYEAMREIEIDNAMRDGTRWVFTTGAKYALAQVARIANTDSRTLWNLETGTVEGVPAFASNNLPTNLVKGSSGAVCHAAILGDFSELMVGEWGGGLEIVVDPFTGARRNVVTLTTFQLADVQFRLPQVFAVFRDILVP